MAVKEVFIWLLVSVFFATASGRGLDQVTQKKHGDTYNQTITLVLVKFASAVYTDDAASLLSWSCPRCIGLTKGFQIADLIVDEPHCLQAFVGVSNILPAIVVAFRGTQERSFHNWLEDLYWKQLDFGYPGVTDAMVHHGFYSAYHNTTLRPRLIVAIQSLILKRPELPIMITGHSMGGAMAAFCALDLTVAILKLLRWNNFF
ncbi:hypothetical protein O6H91_13G083100 [Diphasiastrum complanatum]|uniref:Uncharacterized protein n=1 Tax=Diphasiastrum complanatum TaxID=34168 RepID=A0ACC2BWS5_DIPCM|nr:hypothetical protein O6H91_13G083100 [Diphasiastrum complanatum]